MTDALKPVAQLHPPALYRRVVHDGWPEICTEDEFSDGKGGGQKYVPALPAEKVREIAERVVEDAGSILREAFSQEEKNELLNMAESAIREAIAAAGGEG